MANLMIQVPTVAEPPANLSGSRLIQLRRAERRTAPRRSPTAVDEGLDRAEELVLCPLEDSPLPLWELGWDEAESASWLAEILGPGLVSLVARGLVEVRRFDGWPAEWDHGTLVAGDELLRESGRAEAWRDDGGHRVLAAHITRAGVRVL
ncbi:hypothetical protein [Solwaraspora sp. WMMA2101]|uniref:hypothetical protein n=1 Tax=Solwaraspora sp. WMMA2101 TaxID=3404124 RepID=UPI003B939AE1